MFYGYFVVLFLLGLNEEWLYFEYVNNCGVFCEQAYLNNLK